MNLKSALKSGPRLLNQFIVHIQTYLHLNSKLNFYLILS